MLQVEPASSPWILDSRNRDLLWILTPGFLALLVCGVLTNFPAGYLIAALLVAGLIDCGHLLVTGWRTFLHSQDRKKRQGFIIAFLAIFMVTFFALRSSVPYFLTSIAYVAIFHHLRQYHGIIRWYQKINQRFCPHSVRFMYAMTILAMVVDQTGPGAFLSLGYHGRLVGLQNPTANTFALALYGLTVAAYVVFEIRLWSRGIREPNRILAVISPSLLCGICLFAFDSLQMTLFPILVAHAVPYFPLSHIALKRTQTRPFGSGNRAAYLLAATALAGLAMFSGTYTFVTEVTQNYGEANVSSLATLIVSVLVTFQLSHYIFDSVIWRRNYSESGKVFRVPGSTVITNRDTR